MKNKIRSYIMVLGCLLVAGSGCSKFDDINTNPDRPAEVSSSMLATTLLLNITRDAISTQKSFMQNYMLGKYILWTEFAENQQYNKFSRTSFDGFIVLNNVDKMIEFAPDEGQKKSYTALGHFIRAWKFFNASMEVGDIPYSVALAGESENVINPEYDSQKEVFEGILNELDEADRLFSEGTNFSGDPVYNGNVAKWRKLVNSFELKVLINLYKKTADPALKVKERFQQIVSSRPVFTSNADNFALQYSDKAGQKYPFFKEGNQFIIYQMVSDVLIDRLKETEDYRLFYFTKPSPVKIAGGKTWSDWDAYVGIDPSVVYSDLSAISSSKDFSAINDRYTQIPSGEPVALISYAQVKFMMAEAALRGWITGDGAAKYYEDGIRASMEFVVQYTPDDANYHHNRKIDAAYIQNFLLSDKVKLQGTTPEQLEQIITQAYIANFLQAPYSAYFEYRRTGYPAFPINPASNKNIPSDRIPIRWLYPQKELDYNGEHVNSAISSQYGGNDDVNAPMWILKD